MTIRYRKLNLAHKKTVAVLLGSTALIAAAQSSLAQTTLPNLFPFLDQSGLLETFNPNGSIDLTGPFFTSLGANGRSCGTCHRPGEAWSVTPFQNQIRFLLTAGADPIFRTNDGSNCDHNIDVSSIDGRRAAYSLLLSKGLIRIALPVPAGADFQVAGVQNQYGCNDTSTLSMYRRPLPAANLRFLTTVMWDGRESTPPSTQVITHPTNPGDLLADLAHQALDATSGHAQGAVPLTAQQQQEIVNFEMNLNTAQALDFRAGFLNTPGATGGPAQIATLPFFVGINDPLGNNPFGTAFNSSIFNLFSAWLSLPSSDPRASIARGEQLFNTTPITITGVAGLNDATGLPLIHGFCGTCHSTPNAGNHSVSAPLNIGVADQPSSPLGLGYLPTITLRNIATGAVVTTTDPGRALVTGKFADIGKFKGPILRGLAARAPYFHNGSANTLGDVIDFYNTRFGIGFTAQQKADLVAFLGAL